MMNTKIYKAVHDLAEQLMRAASKEDRETFDELYNQLQAICVENENTDNDHPVQWETLGDFTEELEDAMAIYVKALAKATAINSKDFMASLAFAIAKLQIEFGQNAEAIINLQNAKISANKIEDKDFKIEIDELLESLLTEQAD